MKLRSIALLWLACGAAQAQSAAPVRYTATFDATTQAMHVRLCLDAHAQVRFAADSRWAMRFIHDVRRSADGALAADRAGWSATRWGAGECLSYRADLGAMADTHQTDVGHRLGDDLLTAPQLWLLRPSVWSAGAASIRVALPAGWSICAPWNKVSTPDDSLRFEIPHTPANWSAAVAIGHFTQEPIVLPGGTLRVAILHGATPAQREVLHAWLTHVSRAIVSAYGRLPLSTVQVLVIPVAARSRAVVFGESTRGQGNALQLLVDPSKPLAEFRDDWIAVHELSHLMHPYLDASGAWLAEGLATYYQNVLRARAGLLAPAQAWDRLHQGFADNAGQHYHDTLAAAASGMSRSHEYQRIYWSGAAYWLTVDRDLRRASGNRLNVDLALARFRDCCLPDHRGWQPQAFVARLDALLGTQTFARRYREFADLRQFPATEQTFADLGIRDVAGKVAFDDSAADAALRVAIMAPR